MPTAKREIKRRRNPVSEVRRMNVRGISMETLSAKLPDGTWIAVELRPDSYATAATKAGAEAAVRRRIRAMNPTANEVDEDAIDRAIIRRRKHEKSHPIDRLVKKFLS
jgi:hypothetical protein